MADKRQKRIETRSRYKLKRASMLEQAAHLHDEMRKLKQSDTGRDHLTFLQRPYARAQPAEAVRKAPVWFTAYMPSIIGPATAGQGQPPLRTLCDPELWSCFAELGIRAIHTGPVLKSGGFFLDRQPYESIDGWFDPITLQIDPVLGTEQDYAQLVHAARNTPDVREEAEGGAKLDAIVIGDIVPGHTGMGSDFHLALQGADHYPGLYVLARVDQVLHRQDERHHHLSDTQIEQILHWPEALNGTHEFTRLLSEKEVAWLVQAHVIPGKPQRSMGTQAGYGWSITREIEGVPDEAGHTLRRWVYLHFFHAKQPTLNFFDPGYAAWRLINGQLNYVVWQLRSTGVRLDANAFLGIETTQGAANTNSTQQDDAASAQTWSEAHPLSDTVTNMLAWQARRLGGFSFEEKNMSVTEIAKSGAFGPDLAYDFITRPAVEHAILTGDASLLSFMYREMFRYGINPGSLVHALQNHDEITYELLHLKGLANDAANVADTEQFSQNAAQIRADMRRLALNRRDESVGSLMQRTFPDFFNMESGNGLCTTIPGLLAAHLGCVTIEDASSKLEQIRRGHLLLAAFNALQPGVFALSGWDLVGAMPISRSKIPDVLLNAGTVEKTDPEKDFRWVNRGSYRLLSSFDDSGQGSKAYGCFSLPEAHALYGPLDLQRKDELSFFSELKQILQLRDKLNLAESTLDCHLDLGMGLIGLCMRLTQPSTAGSLVTAVVLLFNFNSLACEISALGLEEAIAKQWKHFEANRHLETVVVPSYSTDYENTGALVNQSVKGWCWACLGFSAGHPRS